MRFIALLPGTASSGFSFSVEKGVSPIPEKATLRGIAKERQRHIFAMVLQGAFSGSSYPSKMTKMMNIWAFSFLVRKQFTLFCTKYCNIMHYFP